MIENIQAAAAAGNGGSVLTLIICIDGRGGILFNGRRQSQDRLLRADLLREAAGHRLWMSEYSARQFSMEAPDNLSISEVPLEQMSSEDFCFAEDLPLQPLLEHADRLLLYCWNRAYPADRSLQLPLDDLWKLLRRDEFAGSSHEKITKELYAR
jgi:hypothetical protein